MMLDSKQNSTCDYNEELVSFLYDEMDSSKKLLFESHLKNCSGCRDEMAGFSFARNSVQEWRDIEFLPLKNPAVEIQYPIKSQSPQGETVSRGWLTVIRDFFTLSPAWMTATTAVAALAICLGLFAIVVSSLRNNNEFAGLSKDEINVVPSPTSGNQNQNSNISNSNQNKPKPGNSPNPILVNDIPKSPQTGTEQIKTVTKTSVAKPQNLNVKKTGQPQVENKTVRPSPKTSNKKAPSFIDEDEDEDSLTLTDLLEEIGTREIDDKK